MSEQILYNKEVVKRFKNPKFSGEIKNPDAIGEIINPKCGDMVKIFLKIKNNKIESIKFQTFGCAAAIASSDALCEIAKGQTLDNALEIKIDDVVKKLNGLPEQKIHCSLLGTGGLKMAIESYQKKKISPHKH